MTESSHVEVPDAGDLGDANNDDVSATASALSEKTAKWGLLTGVLGAATAFLVLLTTVMGFVINDTRDDREALSTDVLELQQQVSVQSGTINTLRALNEQHLDRIEELASQVPGQDVEGVDDSTPEVYHAGTITLVDDGDAIDFNAPPTAVNWEETSAFDADYISYDSFNGLDMNMDVRPLEKVEPLSFSTCSTNTTLYQPFYNLQEAQVSVGARFCVRGESGRYGTISIKAMTSKYIRLDITTWATN